MSPENIQQATYELGMQNFAFEKEQTDKTREIAAAKLRSTEGIEAKKLKLEERKAVRAASSKLQRITNQKRSN
jgi:hypothetical protein